MRNNILDSGMALSVISIVFFLKAMFHFSCFILINLGPILRNLMFIGVIFVKNFPWTDLKYNLRLLLKY